MNQTEYSLNIPRVESLLPQEKELYRMLLETTINLIKNGDDNMPDLSSLSKAVAGRPDLFKEA